MALEGAAESSKGLLCFTEVEGRGRKWEREGGWRECGGWGRRSALGSRRCSSFWAMGTSAPAALFLRG